MFLRSTNRKKDGKSHRYFSVVENQRVAGDRMVQRTVLYLGEINDSQHDGTAQDAGSIRSKSNNRHAT